MDNLEIQQEMQVLREELATLRNELSSQAKRYHDLRDAFLTLRGEFDQTPKASTATPDSTKTLMAATVVELEQQLKYAEFAVATRDARIAELEEIVQTVKLQAQQLMQEIPIQGAELERPQAVVETEINEPVVEEEAIPSVVEEEATPSVAGTETNTLEPEPQAADKSSKKGKGDK